MTLTLLHLNIFQGKFLPLIIDFLKTHPHDILQFQEVSGGQMSKGGVWSGHRQLDTVANPETIGVDCFETIKKELGYEGVLNITIAKRNDAASYVGNATFFKRTLHMTHVKELFLHPYAEAGDTPISPQDAPRAVLSTTFLLNNQPYTFINCHLAWGPTSDDEPHKIAQGKKLYEYVKSLTTPFVLTGDFNVDQRSQVVAWMSTLGKNLVLEKGITNTLNPHTHAAKVLFPAGLGVDFAFVSKEINVTDFHLIDTPDLSDHLGLSMTLEI